MRGFALGDGFRRTGDQDFAAAAAAFRAEIDNPVGSFNHIEVVLNHHDGIALIAQLVQDFQQLLDIGEVQTGGRLIEDIQRLAGTALGQLARQLHALRLAAGQGRRRLAKADIGQADVHQGLQLTRQRRYGIKEFTRLFDGHIQHFVDGLTLVLNLQRFTVIAFAFALVARHVDIRQEVHLNLNDAVTPQASQRPPRTLKLKRPGV